MSTRVSVLLRTFAAVIAGYGISALWASVLTVGLARVPGIVASGAVLTGMLSSFAICVGVVMWVFAASDLKRMALGILAPTIVLAGALWLLRVTA